MSHHEPRHRVAGQSPASCAVSGPRRRLVRRAVSGSREVRLELMPLLDVVFLLLTFFIYAMAVMVRVEALEVGLAPVAGQGGTAETVEHVLRLEPDGGLSYNDESLPFAELSALLRTLADDAATPRLFVALAEAPADGEGALEPVDRGRVLWDVLQAVEASGLTNVTLVGRPRE